VIAASTPSNCFDYAFIASKLALEHMTPVILLTDGFLANGSSTWKIPSMKDYPDIKPPFVHAAMRPTWQPYLRNAENGVRYWAIPGTPGFAHRIGGLEKDNKTGVISTNSANHQVMVKLRQAKVDAISEVIPELVVQGNPEADLLVVGWGGTFGHLYTAVEELNGAGEKVAFAHFNYINPLPKNTADILKKYRKIVVCELNNGQFAGYLRSKMAGINPLQFNKIEGQPFTVSELTSYFKTILQD
jgi:2-oxoglutarate ferredoxin oxidoreductase subunit alpha